MNVKSPLRVVVTGAAGQISYALLFRIASGEFLGKDQPIILHLLEITPALKALAGVNMELQDGAFPLLQKVVITDDVDTAFADADYAFLVGAFPRKAGMERKDLLQVNSEIFSVQGKAINRVANPNIKIIVVGNPANTNALILASHAPKINPRNISAMTRLDHNRAIALLAQKCGVPLSEVNKIAIWGNHSSTQFPDLHHTTVGGKPALAELDDNWYKQEFIPQVQQRGAAVIQARGASSAASAAHAALSHMRDWQLLGGEQQDDWTSMAIYSDGSYGIAEGLFYSFPVLVGNGEFEIVQGLNLSDYAQEKLRLTEQELLAEREQIKEHLGRG